MISPNQELSEVLNASNIIKGEHEEHFKVKS